MTNGYSIKIKMVCNELSGGVSLHIMKTDHNTGKRYLAKPVTLEFDTKDPFGEADYYTARKPFIYFGMDFKDEFIKAIHEMFKRERIRPEDEYINEGKLVAMKSHLSDMRKIVGKKLGVSLNE